MYCSSAATFTAIDTKATAAMLAALGLGLPAYVLIKVLHPSFFAREDTNTPTIYAGISMAANIVLGFTLFLALGAIGIAIATTLSGWLNVVLLVAALRRRGAFKLDQIFRRHFAGLIAASAVMGIVGFGLVNLLDSWFALSSGLLAQGTALITLVARGLLVYLGAAHLFRATHFGDLIKDARPVSAKTGDRSEDLGTPFCKIGPDRDGPLRRVRTIDTGRGAQQNRLVIKSSGVSCLHPCNGRCTWTPPV